jgi:hypothetical protein
MAPNGLDLATWLAACPVALNDEQQATILAMVAAT